MWAPLVVVLISSLFFFVIIYAGAVKPNAGGKAGGFQEGYLSFLGVFLLTAPAAWVYAIPVEHFTGADALASAKWNMGLLALVSLWRVALIVRVVLVLTGATWWKSLLVVLFPASVEAFLGSFYGQLDIVGLMGGIELSPSAAFRSEALSLVNGVSFLIAVVTFIPALAPTRKKHSGKCGFRLEMDPPPRGALTTSGVCLAAWIAYAIPFQLDPELREPRLSIEREASVHRQEGRGSRGSPSSRAVDEAPRNRESE